MYRIGKEEAEAAARVIESGDLFRVGSKHAEAAGFEKSFASVSCQRSSVTSW